MKKPRLALTLGDPAGIGAETIVSAWSQGNLHAHCRPLIVGSLEVVERAVALLGCDLTVVPVSSVDDAALGTPFEAKTIACLSVGSADAAQVAPGKIDARGGQAAYDAIAAATELALSGDVDGMVTGPLNKAALQAAGHNFPGHTELLAELCGVPRTAMMLYLPPSAQIAGPIGLGVVHVTLHMGLREVFDHLSEEEIVARTQLASDVMVRIGGDRLTGKPRIGVCALNPHGGEEGLFGKEEIELITPAVAKAKASGLQVEGPYPTDTLMVRARAGEFDAIVAMYHDQGHIALKLLGMHEAVNITLGLPIVRTSVAHGTAFDRAWTGTAEATGVVEAVKVASRLAGEP